MGKAALDGQKGVIKVEKGWRKMREVNRVVYDPALTDLSKLEGLLKNSGTYISTISAEQQDD